MMPQLVWFYTVSTCQELIGCKMSAQSEDSSHKTILHCGKVCCLATIRGDGCAPMGYSALQWWTDTPDIQTEGDKKCAHSWGCSYFLKIYLMYFEESLRQKTDLKIKRRRKSEQLYLCTLGYFISEIKFVASVWLCLRLGGHMLSTQSTWSTWKEKLNF